MPSILLSRSEEERVLQTRFQANSIKNLRAAIRLNKWRCPFGTSLQIPLSIEFDIAAAQLSAVIHHTR